MMDSPMIREIEVLLCAFHEAFYKPPRTVGRIIWLENFNLRSSYFYHEQIKKSAQKEEMANA